MRAYLNGSDELGHVKVVRGKIHDYLAMILDFTQDGVLKLDMKYYIEGMIEDFPYDVTAIKSTPWTEKLFKVQKDAKKLEEERRSIFHTFVMKGMFLCKRGRPELPFYLRESKKQTRAIGRNYCGSWVSSRELSRTS